MSKEKQKNRIVPINNKLYDSMFVTNIESRLESDPLLTGSLIDLQYVDERIELCINGGNTVCEPNCATAGALGCTYPGK
jgi:hypothetical protein